MKSFSERSGIERYLREIGRHPLMDRDEEQAVARELSRTGSPVLAGKLVAANLRLVLKIALEYHRRGRASLPDLVQEGNLGLVQAVRRFDPSRGVKLSSYAAWWIRAYILKSIRVDRHLVRLGETVAHRKLFSNLGKEREKLERLGLPADVGRLARALGVGERELLEVDAHLAAPCLSLDERRWGPDGEQGGTLADLLRSSEAAPDQRLESAEIDRVVADGIRKFAASLPERELEILRDRLHSDEPTSLKRLARRFGISRERVRQIEVGMKRRLRSRLAFELGDAGEREVAA